MVATASAVVLHGSGRTAPDHRRGVLGEVLVAATWSAPHKIAGGRGRTSFQLVLVLRVLTLTPPPSALEGRPAPNPVVTPRHSSHTSALGDYKQTIQCWASNWQGFASQVRKRARQTLGTLTSQEYPAMKQPNTALQVSCVKVLTTVGSPGTQFQGNLRPEPPSLYDGSSPLHSKQQEAKFTRGPVHVSPCSTQRTQRNIRSSSWSKCETHNPASVFSLQSQITMSRRHSPTCDETKRPITTMHRT